MSERRACQLVGNHRSTIRYQLRRQDDSLLREQVRKIALEHRRFGYRRITVMLRRSGEVVNHKRVYRVYSDMGLKLVKRGRRKRALGVRTASRTAVAANEQWAIDFVHDSLVDGRRLRLLSGDMYN